MTRAQKLWLGGGLVGAAAAAGVVVAALTSDHESQRVLTATLLPLVGLSFLTAGLVAWTRAFFGADQPVVYTIAAVFGSVFFGAFIHLLLAYPRG